MILQSAKERRRGSPGWRGRGWQPGLIPEPGQGAGQPPARAPHPRARSSGLAGQGPRSSALPSLRQCCCPGLVHTTAQHREPQQRRRLCSEPSRELLLWLPGKCWRKRLLPRPLKLPGTSTFLSCFVWLLCGICRHEVPCCKELVDFLACLISMIFHPCNLLH